jgi:hypothetical protein
MYPLAVALYMQRGKFVLDSVPRMRERPIARHQGRADLGTVCGADHSPHAELWGRHGGRWRDGWWHAPLPCWSRH